MKETHFFLSLGKLTEHAGKPQKETVQRGRRIKKISVGIATSCAAETVIADYKPHQDQRGPAPRAEKLKFLTTNGSNVNPGMCLPPTESQADSGEPTCISARLTQPGDGARGRSCSKPRPEQERATNSPVIKSFRK